MQQNSIRQITPKSLKPCEVGRYKETLNIKIMLHDTQNKIKNLEQVRWEEKQFGLWKS